MATLRLTQTKSVIRRTRLQRACLRGLGLRRIGHTVQVEDTPEHMGMINKVDFMLRVEPAESKQKSKSDTK